MGTRTASNKARTETSEKMNNKMNIPEGGIGVAVLSKVSTVMSGTSISIWIESGGDAVIPLNVSVPSGETGYNGFRAVAESTRCAPVQYDTGILVIL